MQVSLTTAMQAVDFQKPLEEIEVKQDSLLFTLPLEILEQIGRSCSDAKTAIAYTRSCRSLYVLRPKILTTDPRKLSWTLQILATSINKMYLASFLEYCKTSPVRHASFHIFVQDLDIQNQIVAVLPNAQVHLLAPPLINEFPVQVVMAPPPPRPPHVMLPHELIDPQIYLQGNPIRELLENQRRAEPFRIIDYIQRDIDQQRIITLLQPPPPVLELAQIVRIQQEMQRLEQLQQQRDPIADVVNQIQNFIGRFF